MIVLKGKDGSVAIMNLAPGADKNEAIRKFKEAHPNKYIDHWEHEGELPSSREFRDAWTIKGSKIVVDDNKAKSIHLSRIRLKRNELLDQLDKEHLRHINNEEKLKEIEIKKQALRDLPANVTNLEWPELLGDIASLTGSH